MRLSNLCRNTAIVSVVTSFGLLLGGTAQAGNHTTGDMMTPTTEQQADPMGTTSSMSIVDVASGSDSFNTLVQAVQAAGLSDTLSGEGP